ncbi:hypothetical protein B0H14DRAFT_873788 [Mycena olivaceomarginata]|nr:hypothetical protein B0H14DRAFT_873788 [Mycena olivaceomarginata]
MCGCFPAACLTPSFRSTSPTILRCQGRPRSPPPSVSTSQPQCPLCQLTATLLYTVLTYPYPRATPSLDVQLPALCTPLFAGGLLAVWPTSYAVDGYTLSLLTTPWRDPWTMHVYTVRGQSSTRRVDNALSTFWPATHPLHFPWWWRSSWHASRGTRQES